MERPRASSRFFENRACACFPCHPGMEGEAFNCLFCFCPLYALGRACGGQYTYNGQGIKDCSSCVFPHRPENYDAVLARFGEMAEVVRRMDGENASAGRD